MVVLAITLLLAGFVILIKGADFLVGGASSVAKKIQYLIPCHWPNCSRIWYFHARNGG
jgi:hypothetical protein